MASSIEWLRLPLFLLVVTEILAQDYNWGKKVPCFVVQGEIACPGCNQRRGLYCPRSTYKRNCDTQFRQRPTTTTWTTITETEATILPTTTEAETTTLEQVQTEFTTGKTVFDNQIDDRPETTPWDIELHLYQILSQLPKRRMKRESESCRWNGDCPCPQICCYTPEDGCEKKCRMGIRLPPPFGTG